MSADIPTTKIRENDEISWLGDICRLELCTRAHERLYYLGLGVLSRAVLDDSSGATFALCTHFFDRASAGGNLRC
jgi:hypothetical protein